MPSKISGVKTMSVQQFQDVWLAVFTNSGFSEEEAISEFQEWTSGLDGEWSNEYNQTEHSVHVSAQERADEIKSEAMIDALKSAAKGNLPFQYWQLSLSKGNKLPRGKWFKGKQAGIVVIIDEFSEYHTQN